MTEIETAVGAAMSVLGKGGSSAAVIAAAAAAAQAASNSLREQSNLPVQLDEFGRDVNKQKRIDMTRRAEARKCRKAKSELRRMSAVTFVLVLAFHQLSMVRQSLVISSSLRHISNDPYQRELKPLETQGGLGDLFSQIAMPWLPPREIKNFIAEHLMGVLEPLHGNLILFHLKQASNQLMVSQKKNCLVRRGRPARCAHASSAASSSGAVSGMQLIQKSQLVDWISAIHSS